MFLLFFITFLLIVRKLIGIKGSKLCW